MNYLLRLFHTVRYLKVKQIVYRLYYRWRNVSTSPMPVQAQARQWQSSWSAPQWQASPMVKEGEFCFLNESGVLTSVDDWNSPDKSKLWLYNLHYLDALNTQNADSQLGSLNKLIDRWIDENPEVQGNGWEAYPTSLRLTNLVKWQMRHHYSGNKLLNSIQQQAVVLSKQVEYHILANHLFANGKALVFAGAALSDRDDFLQQGLAILDKEIPEQFLEDGGHFELSPMYHATMLWDLCDLLNLAKSSGLPELTLRSANWRAAIQRGLIWLAHMCHPDGDVSFFNDSTWGIAPHYNDLCEYASYLDIKFQTSPSTQPHLSAVHLHNTGYMCLTSDSQTKLLFDVGAVGPNYQPGHAHADTLSVELTIFGQRLFVNSGISQYGVDKKRSYQRSTKAHNTVTIDDKNSSDVWGGFRVGKRAFSSNIQITNTDEQVIVSGSHNGYRSLFNPVIHSRECQLTRDYCRIADSIKGSYQKAEARYYLHPDVRIKSLGLGSFECRFPSGQSVLLTFTDYTDIYIEDSEWYPSFGIKQDNCCLVAVFSQQSLSINITW